MNIVTSRKINIITSENKDTKEHLLRIYGFPKKEDATNSKIKVLSSLLEEVIHLENVTKIAMNGEFYGPSPRLFYREATIVVKRFKEFPTIITVGARHHRRPVMGDIYSKKTYSQMRIFAGSAAPEHPLNVKTDPLALFLSEYLSDLENSIYRI